MSRKRDFFHTGLDVARSECQLSRRMNNGMFAGAAIGAADYYVDGNVLVSGNGSLDDPYSTLEEAIADSDAAITLATNRWWARRNRIFVMGDTLTETLVKFPTKCDVIGVGAYDTNPMPGITGHHVPIGESYSTRFFNICFNGIAAAAPIITISSVAGGMEFHGCILDAAAGTLTSGILATASMGLKVYDSIFRGTFATSYISFGAGNAGRCEIAGNRMLGTAAKGIVAASTMTGTTGDHLIDNNIIKATGLVIDDDSDLFFVTNNQLFTEADPTATLTGAVDLNMTQASNNRVTSDAGTERNAPLAVEVIA